jgi:hypothetical protein
LLQFMRRANVNSAPLLHQRVNLTNPLCL